MSELLPCPFCGGEAERIDFGPGSGDNEGGSCIACKRCQSSGPVEFGYKENFVSTWNTRRPTPEPQGEAVAYQCRLIDIENGKVVDNWRECSKESYDIDCGSPRDGAYLRTEYRQLYTRPQPGEGGGEVVSLPAEWRAELLPMPEGESRYTRQARALAKNYNCALTACADELEAALSKGGQGG